MNEEEINLVQIKKKESVEQIKLAADKGDVKAKSDLWNFYYTGHGVQPSYEEDFRQKQLAAVNEGEYGGPAHHSLGDCY